MNQFYFICTGGNTQCIAHRHSANMLAIAAYVGLRTVILDQFNVSRAATADHDGPVGQRMRADGRQHDGIEMRFHDRPADAQRIRGRTGGSGGDKAVAPVGIHIVSVNSGSVFQHTGGFTPLDYHVVYRDATADNCPCTDDRGTQQHAGFLFEVPAKHSIHAFLNVFRPHVSQKAQPTPIYAQYRNGMRRRVACGMQHGAISADGDYQVGTGGQHVILNLGMAGRRSRRRQSAGNRHVEVAGAQVFDGNAHGLDRCRVRRIAHNDNVFKGLAHLRIITCRINSMANDITGKLPDERAKHILRTLVQQFIRDGQPVGSRTLSKASGLSLSPATIRNVMADLEDFGFIASPHTSAGRLPTPKGYRFFVDALMKFSPVDEQSLRELQILLTDEQQLDRRAVAETASTALSALTSMAGLVTLPKQTHVTLRQIEFLPISDRRVLTILVTSESEVQNRILNMDRDFKPDELRRAANYLNDNFAGKEISEIRRLVLEELEQTQQSMNQLMIDTITFAQRALDAESSSGFVMTGETKLMNYDELSDINKLRKLFEAFSQQREILGLLDRSIAADGVQIFIGEESGCQMLDSCSIVTAPYKVNNDVVGVLGVIGPTRMAYERVVPIVDITAKLVGAALNQGSQ